MKPTRTVAVGAALLAAVTAGVATFATGNAQATSGTGVATNILATSTFGPLKIDARTKPADTWGLHVRTHGDTDGYVVDNVFSPGGSTGWHSHPGPSLIFVVRGAVTSYDSDDPSCAGTDYTAGSTFEDAGGRDVHMLVNNGTVDAETIAVQYLPHGAARRIEADPPKNCAASVH